MSAEIDKLKKQKEEDDEITRLEELIRKADLDKLRLKEEEAEK